LGSGPPGVLSAEAVSLLDMLPECVALFEQGADGTLRPCLRNRAFRAGLPGLGEGGALPDALEQALRRVFAGAASATAVLELRPGSQPRWFELLVRPYRPASPTSAPAPTDSEARPPLPDGHALPVAIALVHAADVTQRVRGERAHRESESLLGAILETCAVGLCLCDQRGRFVSVNRAFCELFGFRPEELIGRMFSKILPPEEHDHALGMFQEFMTGERKSGDTQELRARRRDGTVLYVAISASLLYREDGGRFLVGSIMDVTERKEQAAHLRERADDAEREAQSKSELLSSLRDKLALIERQHQQILDLSAPVLDIWDGVLALPLIGTLDPSRAQTVTERVLEAVVRHRARTVLLDLTGAARLDEQAAQIMLRLVRAIRLLGARAMLTGLGPEAVQVLISLGLDLSELTALRSLKEGLHAAVAR
jgi:rsbT co-antagonist protein RsbR